VLPSTSKPHRIAFAPAGSLYQYFRLRRITAILWDAPVYTTQHIATASTLVYIARSLTRLGVVGCGSEGLASSAAWEGNPGLDSGSVFAPHTPSCPSVPNKTEEQPATARRSVLALPHGLWRQPNAPCTLFVEVTCKEATELCAGNSTDPNTRNTLCTNNDVLLSGSSGLPAPQVDAQPDCTVGRKPDTVGGAVRFAYHHAPQPTNVTSLTTPYALLDDSGIHSSASQMEQVLSRSSTSTLAPPVVSPAPSDSTMMMALAASSTSDASSFSPGGSACHMAGAARSAQMVAPCSSERSTAPKSSVWSSPTHPARAGEGRTACHASTLLPSGPSHAIKAAAATHSPGSANHWYTQLLPARPVLDPQSTGGSAPSVTSGSMLEVSASMSLLSLLHPALVATTTQQKYTTPVALSGKPAGSMGSSTGAAMLHWEGGERLSPSLYVKGLPAGNAQL
jgi:hypothetical protein